MPSDLRSSRRIILRLASRPLEQREQVCLLVSRRYRTVQSEALQLVVPGASYSPTSAPKDNWLLAGSCILVENLNISGFPARAVVFSLYTSLAKVSCFRV